MSEGFVLTPWTAGVFFRYCMRYNISDQKDKLAVMRRLVGKKKAKYVRDPKAFMTGKNVLKIDKREPPNV